MTKAQWRFDAQKRVLDLGSSEQSWETGGNPVGHTGPLGRDRMGSAKDVLHPLHSTRVSTRITDMSFFVPYLLNFPLQDQVGAGLQGPDPLPLGAHGAGSSSC